MSEEHISNPEFGLSIGTIAPIIDTKDVFENPINSTEMFRENRGIIVDFFRGAW